MALLETLEKKILEIVNRNKELEQQVRKLTNEKEDLLKQKHAFEATTKKTQDDLQVLQDEKNLTKSTIENILDGINKLDKNQQNQP